MLRTVRNLVATELVAYLIFTLIALSADWGQIYDGLPIGHYLSFTIIEFGFLAAVQVLIIIWTFRKTLYEPDSVDEIVRNGENDRTEFKSSLRWDLNSGQVNKSLEKSVFKTIAAFMNSEGGNLVLGADDKGNPVGIENDLRSLPKPSTDGFEGHFNNIFSTMIGAEYRRFVQLQFHQIGGKQVCLVKVDSSHKPVYLRSGEGEDFYIRTGNTTTPLKISEVATYVSTWWGNR